jgi:hypothetical protein
MEKSSVSVSSSPLTLAELGQLLSTLADEYQTTIPAILSKLDSVSGDLQALHRALSGDKSAEWSKEEDDLMTKNPEILKKWKGAESADLRKKYLVYKSK